MATRDRRDRLLDSLARLRCLPERPPIVVVDNGSSDGTPAAVRTAFPEVDVVALERNAGSAARTAGVRRLDTPFVAFSDDDSWWAPGALARAERLLADCPRLGLVAARVLVGPNERLDPTSRAMARSPLPAPPALPGPRVLGFVACGAVVRREAYLDVGGFEPRFGVGGEEELLAIDMTARGWMLAYAHEVEAHHHPAASSRPGRDHRQARNALWSAWLRRPARRAAARTLAHARRATRDRTDLVALAAAVRGVAWVARQRRTVPPELERDLRLLEG